jgi:hypothetical protein
MHSAAADRVIFFLLDGARIDVMRDLLERGDLPNVARYLGGDAPLAAATSVFPSVTGVAYVPFVTGRFPGPANIPGIRWFDRERYARKLLSVSRFRDYNGLGSYLMDRDLSRHAKTLFELAPPASNIFSGISRGTGMRKNAAYFKRIPYVYYFFRTGDWDPIDREGRSYLLRAARRQSERFTFHTTLSVDEYSHKLGPFAPRVLDSYRKFDSVVGELAQALAQTGQLERTMLVLSADHGHTEVHSHMDLEGFFERRGLRTLYSPARLPRYFDCDAACMVGGNGMAHVYLRGAKGWPTRVVGDELLAGYPHLVEDLLAEPAVHLVAWRAVGDPGTVTVRTRRGTARIAQRGGAIDYGVTAGGDPFGYPELPPSMTRTELLEHTFATDYPDAPLQLAQLFESPRTGDLVLSAEKGYDLRQRFERWDHRSCHGSLHREHMQVPLAANRALHPGPARTVDVFGTVLAALGLPVPPSDGRNLLAFGQRFGSPGPSPGRVEATSAAEIAVGSSANHWQ